ncbi:Gfo/Idh/MocA family oxidoreductase [Limibaculum sp. FT325]|uniref:Gfo/Idh/MocA family protein n=1 Tax=Thermohalobaculum sediminis TaxID=2939436 RepID=UPI0020C13810|nr:Gfo/Idh/MocA family oxidoreductase [Limibaculum sediminis]MCL5776506.1 Gfo/Idh/MocA family oxidoreductase [Limibaculum sediminis]
MAKTYGVAIIGLGVIGRRMLTNMPQQGRLAIVGGWDLDPAACARAAADFPGLAIAASAEALIGSPQVDAVYIGVPPRAHGLYARAAIAAGKAVFCEKPLGVDLADSRALVEVAREAGAVQAVNLSLAAARGVSAMRAALAEGSLGPVAGADIRLHFTRWPRGWQASASWLAGRAEGGFTREVATHFLYLADALFGPGELIAASAAYPGDDGRAETHVLAQLDFGGVPVTLAGSVGGAGPDLVEFTLWGERRSLRLSDFYRLSASAGEGWENALPEIGNPALDAYMLQLDELVRMLDGEAHVLPDFATALRVQELVEGILAD